MCVCVCTSACVYVCVSARERNGVKTKRERHVYIFFRG